MSTTRSVSVSRSSASGATSLCTPVDVSACTTASTRALGWSRRASSSRCGSIARPHGASTRTMSPPHRRATSHMRSPNTPLTPMITVSPGSTRLTKHVSMPAEPVPLMGNVSVFSVRNTARSRSPISSSTARKSGSRCPSTGRWNASITSGNGFDGPGPSSSRSAWIMNRSYAIQRARPSRMSASDTRSSSKPQCRITRHDDDHAADDHVDPTGFESGIVTAPRDRLGRERAEDLLGRDARQAEMVDAFAPAARRCPSSIAPMVHTVPAVPISVFAFPASGIARSTSARWSRTIDTATLNSSALGGSECRICSVSRTQPTSIEINAAGGRRRRR